MNHSKRLGLRHFYSILQDATCSTLQTVLRVRIVGECASQSSDDDGAFPRHLYFINRLRDLHISYSELSQLHINIVCDYNISTFPDNVPT